MKNCCGKGYSQLSNYCAICGKALEKEICICGNVRMECDNYCTMCGRKWETETQNGGL